MWAYSNSVYSNTLLCSKRPSLRLRASSSLQRRRASSRHRVSFVLRAFITLFIQSSEPDFRAVAVLLHCFFCIKVHQSTIKVEGIHCPFLLVQMQLNPHRSEHGYIFIEWIEIFVSLQFIGTTTCGCIRTICLDYHGIALLLHFEYGLKLPQYLSNLAFFCHSYFQILRDVTHLCCLDGKDKKSSCELCIPFSLHNQCFHSLSKVSTRRRLLLLMK